MKRKPSKPSSRARAARQKTRVEKAVEKAQARIPTAFHISVVPFNREEKREAQDEGVLMTISPTRRGPDDRNHFVMQFDPTVAETVSFPNLVKVAGHETIHALLWPITDLAQYEGISDSQAELLRRENESLTYTLQRALFGELDMTH